MKRPWRVEGRSGLEHSRVTEPIRRKLNRNIASQTPLRPQVLEPMAHRQTMQDVPRLVSNSTTFRVFQGFLLIKDYAERVSQGLKSVEALLLRHIEDDMRTEPTCWPRTLAATMPVGKCDASCRPHQAQEHARMAAAFQGTVSVDSYNTLCRLHTSSLHPSQCGIGHT